METITHDMHTTEWEQIQNTKDNLTLGECKVLQELKELPDLYS